VLKQQRLDKSWIAQHIPHQGTMCLLDNVESWDAETIVCSAISHRELDNPLRSNQQLATTCGIEYAAQAMAVHGALLAPADSARPKSGYLVSIRSTQLYVARLDDIASDLKVEAICIARNDNDVLYQFNVHAQGRLLIDGRAAVVLNVNAPSLSSQNTTGNTL